MPGAINMYCTEHFFFGVLSVSNTGFLALIKQVTDEGFVKKAAGQQVLLPIMLFGLMFIRGIAGYISI